MSSAERVLVVAPHADDETIGMGGTIAKHAAAGAEVFVAVVTGHGEERPHPLWKRDVWDTVRAEAAEACEILGVKELMFADVPAVEVDQQPAWKLNQITGAFVTDVKPDVLYVPFPYDLHKDHREIFHSLSVAWRSSSTVGRAIRDVYCYEVQSETHWNIPYVEPGFLPTCWVDITAHLDTKVRAFECYKSQLKPPPDARSIEAVRALATWRGSQQHMGAAEAFVTVRAVR